MLISLSIVCKLAKLRFPTVWWMIAFIVDSVALTSLCGA